MKIYLAIHDPSNLAEVRGVFLDEASAENFVKVAQQIGEVFMTVEEVDDAYFTAEKAVEFTSLHILHVNAARSSRYESFFDTARPVPVGSALPEDEEISGAEYLANGFAGGTYYGFTADEAMTKAQNAIHTLRHS